MPELKLNFFEEFCIIENEEVFEVYYFLDFLKIVGFFFAGCNIYKYKFKFFAIFDVLF